MTARRRRATRPTALLVVLLISAIAPIRAFGADTASRSLSRALETERGLSTGSGDRERRAVAAKLVAVADRFPASAQAREALLHAARVLVPTHGSVQTDAIRTAVEIRRRFSRDYPEDPRAPAVQLAAAEIERTRLGDAEAARATLTDLVIRFPASETASVAFARLTELGDAAEQPRPSSAPVSSERRAGEGTSLAPRVTRIRSWSGPGGTQLVLDLNGEASASGEWDPNDLPAGDDHVFRVTIPEARPAPNLSLPDVSGDRWVAQLTVLERASGGLRIEVRVREKLEHEAFSLGDRVVITLGPSIAARAAGPVILDPGHGGKDPGARSAAGLLEKDLTLAIARRVAGRLDDQGVPVILTRHGDQYVPLEERTAIANTSGGAVLVSIHANASTASDARGVETYFLSATRDARALQAASRENGWRAPGGGGADDVPAVIRILDDLATQFHASESRRLARVVHEVLVHDLAVLRQTTDLGVKQAPFVVLMGSEMPALLAEVGFITHPDEGRWLGDVDYQDAIAVALARGILAFIGRGASPYGSPS